MLAGQSVRGTHFLQDAGRLRGPDPSLSLHPLTPRGVCPGLSGDLLTLVCLRREQSVLSQRVVRHTQGTCRRWCGRDLSLWPCLAARSSLFRRAVELWTLRAPLPAALPCLRSCEGFKTGVIPSRV